MAKTDYLIENHDLSLSDWGPYAGELFGLSHIADKAKGHRVDFFMTPGMFRRETFPPDTLRECGLSLWEAAPDLHYYCYRQQLIAKDQIYSDISYSNITENCWLARCEFVNNTGQIRDTTLEIYGGLSPNRSGAVIPQLPEGAVWLNAVQHKKLEYAVKRFSDSLTWDGWRRGEELCPGTVTGYAVGNGFCAKKMPENKAFGYDADDRIFFDCPVSCDSGVVILRYKMYAGTQIELEVDHAGFCNKVCLAGNGDFTETVIYRGKLTEGAELMFHSRGGVEMWLDGLMFGPVANSGEFKISQAEYPNEPDFSIGGDKQSMLLKFPMSDGCYGLWWSSSQSVPRTFYTDDIVRSLSHGYATRNPYCTALRHDAGLQKFAGIYIIPINLAANDRVVIYAIINRGASAMECERVLCALDRSDTALEAIYHRERARRINCSTNANGERYQLSQQLMAATVFSNVTFPVYTKGRFVKHHTPARYYNSLYTWDSGFTGLALNEFDSTRAIESLNTYVTEPGDEESAFILHGTPLPVQSILYQDIYNFNHDSEILAFFYPRLRQYYRFLAGHNSLSTTRIKGSNLLATWNYFYNSGGWDDYPPQWEIYKGNLKGIIAPAVSTAYAIRFAKILRSAALRTSNNSDLSEYDSDIAMFSKALQQYSWDAEAGCFSYVCHDAKGRPAGFFRHKSGLNYNLGMDGATPLSAGICTKEQQEKLFGLLKSLLSPAGLSTVSTTVPYYRADGYWNGSVWMPHQWLFWKAALDYNQADFARKIADTALDIWKREVDDSYYCYEHFSNHTGRGGGNHAFGGLSSPVLKWFNAYFRPGRLTGGFDLWIDAEDKKENKRTFKLQIDGNPGDKCNVLYVEDMPVRQITYQGRNADAVSPRPGLWEITLEKGSGGELSIEYVL